MAVDEQLPRYSQIAGGSYKVHPGTNQAGASQENVSDDLQIWVIVTPEEGPMPTTPGGSHDTAQPGAISATNQQQSAGETAGGILDESYIELPCLVILPSDDNTENGSTGVQLPKSSNVEEAFPSTSGEDMVVLLVTDMKISDGKGNGDQNTTNYQDGGTAVHYVTPHESLSHNNEPPALHSEKTQMAKKETSLPLPVSSSGACDDAVPSTSRADKNAAALATNNASRARAQRASANAGSRETASTPGKFRAESSASSRRSTRATSQATTGSASPCERPASSCTTISDGSCNAELNTTNYQDGDTAIHCVTPHESLSLNEEPLQLPSEKTHTDKKETGSPLLVSSSGASGDAVPSTSRADKNAAALAGNNASRARAQRASANAGSRKTASTPGKFRGESSASSRRSTRSTSQATTASASPCERPATTCRTDSTGTTERKKRKDISGVNGNVNHGKKRSGKRRHKCEICGQSFKTKSSLLAHRRTHAGDKPYRCDTCAKSFSQKGNLGVHLRTHTGEKPFHCHMCAKSFAQKCQMVVHLRRHTGEKPFKCATCPKSFAQPANLRVHERMHADERPYKCKMCRHSSKTLAALKKHQRVHRNKKT